MRRLRRALVVLALVAGCGGESAPPPARTPTPLDHATTGVIAGEVRVEGGLPPMPEIRFGSFAECAAQHPDPVRAEDLVAQDGKLANAFVWIKDGLGDRVFAIPAEPVEVDQSGCLFQPRVTGARVGQTIRFTNGDPLLHNVRGTPRSSPAWNASLPRRGATRDVRLDRPEVGVNVRCDLHPWMQSWLAVVDHPYFAVTGPDGAYALRDVPPGEYTVAVWHERLGTRETRVTLAPQGTATARFSFTTAP